MIPRCTTPSPAIVGVRTGDEINCQTRYYSADNIPVFDDEADWGQLWCNEHKQSLGACRGRAK